MRQASSSGVIRQVTFEKGDPTVGPIQSEGKASPGESASPLQTRSIAKKIEQMPLDDAHRRHAAGLASRCSASIRRS